MAYVRKEQRASVQKAEAFLSQVETMKGAVRGLYYERADPALVDDAACAMRVLQSLKVQGTPLSGDPAQDAHTLGYAALDLGTFDIVDGSGTVVQAGSPATVTLPNRRVVTSADR